MHKKFNNFFSQEEINILKSAIRYAENNGAGMVYKQTGRKLIGLDDLDKKIIDKVEFQIKELYKKDLKVKDIGFMRFKKEYGDPKLLPHVDDYACEVVFDYQLNTNKKWDLFIEGNRVELSDNDAVCFEGEAEAHWREKIKFNDDEFVEMICFNCVGNDHWRNSSDINPNELERIKLNQDVVKKWRSLYLS